MACKYYRPCDVLYLSLSSNSPGLGCLCRHSEIHVHVLYLVFFMHNTDKTNRIEQNALKDQENEFGEVLGR